MINLLPQNDQAQLRAGASNVLLLRYVLFSLGILVVLLVLMGLSYAFMKAAEISADDEIRKNTQQASSFAKVEAEATSFKNDLAQSKQILEKETQYTKLLTSFAAQLPKGVVMNQIALDASTFGTPTTLQLSTKTYQDALRLKTSFQDSAMFKDVSFSSITESDAEDSAYPYAVQLNVTIVNPKDAAK